MVSDADRLSAREASFLVQKILIPRSHDNVSKPFFWRSWETVQVSSTPSLPVTSIFLSAFVDGHAAHPSVTAFNIRWLVMKRLARSFLLDTLRTSIISMPTDIPTKWKLWLKTVTFSLLGPGRFNCQAPSNRRHLPVNRSWERKHSSLSFSNRLWISLLCALSFAALNERCSRQELCHPSSGYEKHLESGRARRTTRSLPHYLTKPVHIISNKKEPNLHNPNQKILYECMLYTKLEKRGKITSGDLKER